MIHHEYRGIAVPHIRGLNPHFPRASGFGGEGGDPGPGPIEASEESVRRRARRGAMLTCWFLLLFIG